MGVVEVVALREATIDVREGEFLVITGPSGSGKSTLLNLLGGMDRPTAGTISFRGKDLTRASESELTRYRRHAVGFVFQFYNLVPNLTAIENVEVACAIARDPIPPREALAMVELLDRADHFPAELSGGEQQRVAIARALAGRPDLILCDEPTGALDLKTSRVVLSILRDLSRVQRKTVVLITHNLAITAIASRIARIHDGRLFDVRENARPVEVSEIEW